MKSRNIAQSSECLYSFGMPFRHLLPIAVVLLAVRAAPAQRITSPYRFIDTKQHAGAFVGTISGGKGAVGLGSKSGPAAGLRYGLGIGGAFMVEAEAVYFPTSHAVLDTVVVDSAFTQLGTADQTLVVGTAALRLNLTGSRTWHGLQPYALLGGGAVIQARRDRAAVEMAPVDARYDFGTSFAGTLGAGIEVFPSQRLAIRVDGRNLLWKIKTPAALLRSSIGTTLPTDEWAYNLMASVGVSIHF
jgi:hypothetical protein